jgi:transcriptional regulator with XRE-family HTH domain
VTLSQYLSEAQLSRTQFAEKIGVSSEAVRRYVAGTRIPDKPIMEKIALATGCKVTANDFFGIAA